MIQRKSSHQVVTFGDRSDELHIGRMDGSVCDGHECWNERRRKLIETNQRTLWYKSLRLFLSIHNYDPFAIFKCTKPTSCSDSLQLWSGRTEPEVRNSIDCRASGRHMLNHPEILLPPTTQADHRRQKYTRILRFFVGYFFIKALIISSSQYGFLKHQLVSRARNPPWLSMDQVESVALYLGNPLQVLKDSAMLLYLGPAGFCVVSFILIPLYYERYPMNIAILRFILEPEHELKRVDLNIKRKLEGARMSLEVFARESQQMLLDVPANTINSHNYRRQFLPPTDFGNASKLLRLARLQCAKLRGYLDEFDRRLFSFRPNLFSAKYFQDSSAKMSSTIAGGHIVYIVCTTGMLSATQVPPFVNRCAIYRQELAAQNRTLTVCNPLDVYTPAELVVLVELTLVLFLSYIISALNLALFSLVTANQADLIESIQKQLAKCRELIYGDGSSVSQTQHRAARNKTQVNRTEPLDLDKFRLEALIKLMVCETELRDNAHSMSELTIHPFYYAGGTVVFLVIVGGQFQIAETQAIRRLIMIATWINVNAVAISCAHIFSRVIEFERALWSILAAQADKVQRHEQSKRSSPSDTPAQVSEGERAASGCCTFVNDLWVKFVLGTSLNVQSYCARPLYVKLTYEMIIELNFFVIFIYELSIDLPSLK